MTKFMVIGGLHGDESLGIDLAKLLRDRPIPGVDAIVGNPMSAAVIHAISNTDNFLA